MPPATDIGNLPPVQPPAGGGHGPHGAGLGALANGGGTVSFADALAQAVGQTAAAGAAHGSHGGGAPDAAPHGTHGGGALTLPGGDPHPGHIALAASHAAGHQFQEVALGLRAYRQQLIASNIANADTPGYKAVDIDVQEALQMAQATAQRQPLTLATTAAGHIAGQAANSQLPYPLKYHVPSQASVDGNTVEMDVERAKFAENTLMYEFSLDRASNHYKMMAELFQKLT